MHLINNLFQDELKELIEKEHKKLDEVIEKNEKKDKANT